MNKSKMLGYFLVVFGLFICPYVLHYNDKIGNEIMITGGFINALPFAYGYGYFLGIMSLVIGALLIYNKNLIPIHYGIFYNKRDKNRQKKEERSY